MKARGEIPIIIFCAEDDEPVLANVVDELRREGMAPQLVPGVEFDGQLVAAAVDDAPEDALFVLCHSPALDKAAVRRLTGLFSARSGPGHQIVEALFTPSRPLAILPTIRSALKEIRLAQQDEGGASSSGASNFRDVVEAFVGTSAMPRRATPSHVADPEQLAQQLARGLDEAAAIMARGRQHRAVRRTPVRVPTSSSSDASRGAESSTASGVVQAPIHDTHNGPPSLERHLSEVPGAPDSLVATDPETLQRLPRSVAPRSSPALDEPRGNRLLLLFAGAGILGIVALAALQLFRPGAADGLAQPPPAAVEPAVAPATPPPPAVAAGHVVAAVPTTPAAPQTPSVPVSVDDVADSTTAADVPPPPKKAMSRRDLIASGLQLAVNEGRLLRVGKLFIARANAEDLTWQDAEQRCRSRRFNGVYGFRLPSPTELRRIRGAGVLPEGIYWTRRKSSDEAVAFDTKTGRTVVYLTIELNARALCVRDG